MTIHEQITALLNGEMTDAAQVSELMHVLAVSPEKQDLLVEQVRMSRAFVSMGGALAPAAAADAAILKGLAAIDAEFPSAPSSTSGVVPTAPASSPAGALPATLAGGSMGSRVMMILASLAILASGVGLGYLYGTGDAAETDAAVRASIARESAASTALRDSLSDSRTELASLSTSHAATLVTLDSLRAVSSSAARPREIVRYVRVPAEREPATSTAPVAPTVEPSQQPSLPRVSAVASEVKPPVVATPRLLVERIGSTSLTAAPVRQASEVTPRPEVGPWQVGVRNHERLSLPRVFGLNASQNVLTDKEVYAAYRLSDDGGVKGGAAFGQTRVGLVLHSNTGGMPVDTITELNPDLLYGRLFVASRILSIEEWKTSVGVELGAGGTEIGPLGTFGLTLDYEPFDRWSIQAGASSWLLLSTYRDRLQSSINFNLHYGVGYRF